MDGSDRRTAGSTAEETDPGVLRRGPGRVLVAVYAIFAVSATGRSAYQLSVQADEAPVPYSLSLVAALIYIAATVALVRGGTSGRRVAWSACGTELVGVLVVGTVSLFVDFPDQTVWSDYGIGYGFVPLVLPVFGLWWLWRTRRHVPPPARTDEPLP